MSRVVFADNTATVDQEALRATHQVRLVTSDEEGTGVDQLPAGVYGFTYTPGIPVAPLFATRRYRNYEIHKLPSGEVYLIGFAKADLARTLSTASEEMTLQVLPQPDTGDEVLVTIPYTSMRRHRQYAAPNQDGFTVTVLPG
jgi:hypothetical protein